MPRVGRGRYAAGDEVQVQVRSHRRQEDREWASPLGKSRMAQARTGNISRERRNECGDLADWDIMSLLGARQSSEGQRDVGAACMSAWRWISFQLSPSRRKISVMRRAIGTGSGLPFMRTLAC